MSRAAEKARENRLRRKAEHQGLRLEKSRRRDIHAPDFNRYALMSIKTGERVHVGHGPDGAPIKFPFDLEAIESLLTTRGPKVWRFTGP
jgi:hypothetical protein